MDLEQLNSALDVELDEIATDAQAILEKDDIVVNETDLNQLVAVAGYEAEAHGIAYRYLTEIDGSYTEEEARAIAWF